MAAARLPSLAVVVAMLTTSPLVLFLGGDVMTGRGVDQILSHPVDPTLHEPWVQSATTYVELAERASGPIPAPVPPSYPWGDLLGELAARRPALRIVNLETAVTAGGEPWPGKGIHYRMHPRNVDVLTAAETDACVLANNHVLDWGRSEVATTLAALRGARLATAGAGPDEAAATAPAVLRTGGGQRVLLFAVGHRSSGIPAAWAAGPGRPGVAYLPALDGPARDALVAHIRSHREPDDLVILSVHWGDNWGWEIPAAHRDFAHAMVEQAGVDLVHGHSSHHARAMEVHQGRLVLYGCGDLLDDYEGITGHAEYRPDLVLAYLPQLSPGDHRLQALTMIPLRLERLQLQRASTADSRWLAETLDRECRELGASVHLAADSTLSLRW